MNLRGRMTLAVAVAVAISVALAALAAYVLTRRELLGQVDGSLRQSEYAIARLPPADLLFFHLPLGSSYYQVVYSSGQHQLPTGFVVPLPVTRETMEVAAGKRHAFYSSRTVHGVPVRMLTFQYDDGAAVQVIADVTDINHALARLRWLLAVVGAGGVALALAIGLGLTRTALAPVRRLTRATEHVAETQDLTSRIEGGGSDELGRLASSFNTMLEALERSVLSQRQLVADASHELRTPLTSLRTNIEVLARADGMAPAEREALLADVVEQLTEISTLVAELVELARGERHVTEPEEIRLDLLVEDAVERARRNTPAVRFEADLAPSTVEGVRSTLERAIGNLLDNAAKWSPPDGRVEVAVRDGEVLVRDHGPGIDEGDLPHIFDRFYRSPAARGRPGSGLGLAIVRQVATAHGGTVEAERPPDGGTLMRLRLGGGGGGPGSGANGNGSGRSNE